MQGTVLQPLWEHRAMRRALNKTFLTHLTRSPGAASAASRVDKSAEGASAVCVSYFVDWDCKVSHVPHVFLFDSQKSTRNTDSSNSPDISLALAKAFRHSFLGRHFWYLQNINRHWLPLALNPPIWALL